MWYAIISEDIENSLAKRLQARPAHLERLQKLKEQGRLLIAGPHPTIDNEDPGEAGFSGSLVVAEFDSLENAQAWAFSSESNSATTKLLSSIHWKMLRPGQMQTRIWKQASIKK